MATRKSTAKPAAKKAAPKRAPRKPAAQTAPPAPPTPVTEEQRQAKIQAYNTLLSAGLEIPKELANEVQAYVTEYKAQLEAAEQAETAKAEAHAAQVAEANKNGPWYIRNCYNAPFNLRLDRQTEKRRIELKARGVPGDMHPIKEEDLTDSVLRTNVNLGLIEVIPAGEAQVIADKQTRNMSTRVHAPLQVLRNELGQKYAAGAVKIEAEYNSQGVTVATLDPSQLQGNVHDKHVQVTRQQPGQPQVPQTVSGFVPTGGNPAIISQGGMDARIQADIARRAQGQREAPLHPGVNELTVTVAPVERN